MHRAAAVILIACLPLGAHWRAVADRLIQTPPESWSWNWGEGVQAIGLVKAYERTQDARYAAWVNRWAEHHLAREPAALLNIGPQATPKLPGYCGYWSPAAALLLLTPAHTGMKHVRLIDDTLEFIRGPAERSPDGALGHWLGNHQLWVDTLYMAAPLLSRLGHADESARQIELYARHLQDAKTGLFAHMYDWDQRQASPGLWGRGNGWVAMALADTFEYLPPGDPRHAPLRAVAVKLAAGLKQTQDAAGLWHTLLDDPSSYAETSASAMFVYGLAKMVRLRVLPAESVEVARKAWAGIQDAGVKDGLVIGVSGGTTPRGPDYYRQVPVGSYPWGTGAYLMAASEMDRLPAPSPYLRAAVRFVDTMMAHGADHYGPEHSPLFAATLDLETLSLPVQVWPEEFRPNRAGLMVSIGHGFPFPPVGVRAIDRSPTGNNLEHDLTLLRAMEELTGITGDPRYAKHVDDTLRYWLRRCQSPETGLPPSGEHLSWCFLRERGVADVHEVARRFPFYERLYAIDAPRALWQADGMWMAQIGDKLVADFSRHAKYSEHGPGVNWGFPRHAGFYIWTYANAYAQSRDLKYVERIETLLESRTGRRFRPYSLMLRPGFVPERSLDPVLRSLLWDAADLVPMRRDIWRKAVREMDEEAFAEMKNPRPWRWAVPDPGERETAARYRERYTKQYPEMLVNGRRFVQNGSLETETTTLPELWRRSGKAGDGLRNLKRYHQTRDERFLRLAEATADLYAAAPFPVNTGDLWPKAPALAISLLVAASREVPAKRDAYLHAAGALASRSLGVFEKNGLFRADGLATHYESITGAGDLVSALVELYCALHRPDRPMAYNDLDM